MPESHILARGNQIFMISLLLALLQHGLIYVSVGGTRNRVGTAKEIVGNRLFGGRDR